MESNFEEILGSKSKFDILLSKKGCWNHTSEKDSPLIHFEKGRFETAADYLFIVMRNSIHDEAKEIQQYCDLGLRDIEERLLSLVEQKMSEFEEVAQARNFDLRKYYSKE